MTTGNREKGKRGRKSKASLTVISHDGIISTARPKTPADLTKEQAVEWKEIVDRMPADWFTKETHPLLTQYCRHIIVAYRIAQLIEQIETSPDPLDIDKYDQLLRMQTRETTSIARLATAMRLTQQAKYTAKAAGTASRKAGTGPKPWEK